MTTPSLWRSHHSHKYRRYHQLRYVCQVPPPTSEKEEAYYASIQEKYLDLISGNAGFVYEGGGNAPPRFFSLKRGMEVEEEEEKVNKKERKSGRSRAEKAVDKAKTQSASVSPLRMETAGQKGMTRSLPTSPSRAPSFSSPSPLPKEKEKYFSRIETICQVERLKRDLSAQRKALLSPLFKLTVDEKSTEGPNNFP